MSFSSDFARVYDRFNDGADYAQKLSLVLSALPEGAKTALDLGCGTGEFSLLLSEKFQTTAVDLSEEMLTVAGAKAMEKEKTIRFLRQDIRTLDLREEFDFCTCLQDTLNYLLTPEDLEKAFSGIASHVKSGGKFFFDLSVKERFLEVYGGQTRFLSRKGAYLIWESAYHKLKELCDFRFTLFLKEPDGRYKISVEEETQRCFDPALVKKIATDHGFSEPEILWEKAKERVLFVCEKKG